MKLQKFIRLSEEEVVNYDFKNESPTSAVQMESHPVKKFFLYRKDYQEKAKKAKFDCDGCNLILEIHANVYSNKKLEYLDSDTMNSFYSTYRLLLRSFDKSFWDNDIITFCNKRGIDFNNVNNKNKKYLLRYDWLLSERVFNHYTEINNLPEVKRFATLTHTLGNMTLLPKGYNVGRATPTKDYWDLTLISLQNFLGSTFDNFVTDYHMQDFTADAIEFWEGHSLEYPLPDSFDRNNVNKLNQAQKDEIVYKRILEFMQKVNVRIEKRSKRLFIALKEKERCLC
ncbi:hypothetical protein [Bacillus sp. RO1]|uniref:hypothetical protein n=1 Tax=Bacillus sp. RO1 TaxID=2722703 RepID=UPI001456372C|nr:hypothetical protein [Bacillus sp. RO1]NLP52034.1 hypothetical protein [Bacillus sp. RO1]